MYRDVLAVSDVSAVPDVLARSAVPGCVSCAGCIGCVGYACYVRCVGLCFYHLRADWITTKPAILKSVNRKEDLP